MKLYTRRGDDGETDLFAGGRVKKDAPRIEAIGAVDELNAALGLALAASTQKDVVALGQKLQSTLFDLGAALATPDEARRAREGASRARDVSALEAAIDTFDAALPPLRRFILPGGSAAAAAFHFARTVCRRAERRCVRLQELEARDAAPLRYLNRLSDLLFVLARVENQRAGIPDVEWQSHD